MTASHAYSVYPVGFIRSELTRRDEAPRQGSEGAPDVWLEVNQDLVEGLLGLAAGQEIIVLTWFHQSARDQLKVHPRGETSAPLAGVFSTRSPARPNPIGLHRVTIRKITGTRIRIGPMEAIEGTPVVDIKPVLSGSADS